MSPPMEHMTELAEVYDRLGATAVTVGGLSIPGTFARPARTHQAVRAGVGVTQHPFGIITVSGDDRDAFLGDTLTCQLPTSEGEVTYGFLLDPDGTIETDMYVAHVGSQLLCVTAPGTATSLASMLSERTFIQDVQVEDVSTEHVVFGVHGPAVETMLRSILREGEPPGEGDSLTRGAVRDHGLTLIEIDAPIGEPGVLAICTRASAGAVFDALVNLGAAAVPFGYDTWLGLTLEAGTPLFETELGDRQPNVCGQLGGAVDLTKGCFVGQEVVARVANLGTIRERLVGLGLSQPMEPGTTLISDGVPVGTITRATHSPVLDRVIGMGFVDTSIDAGSTVRVDSTGSDTTLVELPHVEGSQLSERLPVYDIEP